MSHNGFRFTRDIILKVTVQQHFSVVFSVSVCSREATSREHCSPKDVLPSTYRSLPQSVSHCTPPPRACPRNRAPPLFPLLRRFHGPLQSGGLFFLSADSFSSQLLHPWYPSCFGSSCSLNVGLWLVFSFFYLLTLAG